MSVSPRPTKIIIIVALAAVMIGIALAIVLNYQTSISAIDEAQTTMPDIEVLTPEAIVMKKGETKLIPLEVRIISKEPLDAQIAIFSTTSPEAAEQETTSNWAILMSNSKNRGKKDSQTASKVRLTLKALA